MSLSTNNFKVNELVSISASSSKLQRDGVVAYVGKVKFTSGNDWVGVRLTGSSIGQGSNNGTVEGVKYFEASGPRDGVFVREARLTRRTDPSSRNFTKSPTSPTVSSSATTTVRTTKPSHAGAKFGKQMPSAAISTASAHNQSPHSSPFALDSTPIATSEGLCSNDGIHDASTSEASANTRTDKDLATKVTREVGDEDLISPPLNGVSVGIKLSNSPPLGTVFSKNNEKVGKESIHFHEQDGCYVSREAGGYEKMKDGTTIAERILFTKQSFDAEERKFTGVTDFGGVWFNDYVSLRYELAFDTQYLCILSGKSIWKKEGGDERTYHTYGYNCCYITTNLNNVDDDTIKRLEEEGASAKTINQIKKKNHKLQLANKLATIQAEIANDYATEKINFGDLEDNVFVREDHMGTLSLHFEKGMCPYLSHKHKKHTNKTFDNGNKVPSRLLFSKCSFDEMERRFSGVLDFGGNSLDKSTSILFEIAFDTKFLCVVSGRMVHKISNESEHIENLGEDACYTNTNLRNFDTDTEERLKMEKATQKSIDAVLLPFRKKQVAQYTAEGNTFGELDDGFIHTTKWKWKEDRNSSKYKRFSKYKYGEEQTRFIDMSRPRQCSYRKWDEDLIKYKKVILSHSKEYDPSNPPPVEQRGITLTQLWAVLANIKRRCEKEGWVNHNGEKLTYNTVTLYDAVTYIIKPYTEARQLSFVTCLPSTDGPQPPRFFASHWWGEPVVDFVKCLEVAVRDFGRNENDEDDRRGGGMTAHTPIWVCAYGNNQHNLADDIADEPRKSGFTRAMKAAEGRTISLLDKGGVVFERIWCGYELYLTLVDSTKGEKGGNGLWAVYTAHAHEYNDEKREAVGIISGGTTCDKGNSNWTEHREAPFPFDLIKRSLSIKLENAKASVEEDRIKILNDIIGEDDEMNNANDNPPASHERYDQVNDAVIAAFVSTQSCMQRMCNEDEATWQQFLKALSKGRRMIALSFAFHERGWEGLKGGRAAELVSHLPATVSKLMIWKAEDKDKFGVKFIDSLSKHVAKTTAMESLTLWYTKAEEEKEGKARARLTEAVGSNRSIKRLELMHTDLIAEENVEQWGAALNKNATLEQMRLGTGEWEFAGKLLEITKGRTPKLEIRRF